MAYHTLRRSLSLNAIFETIDSSFETDSMSLTISYNPYSFKPPTTLVNQATQAKTSSINYSLENSTGQASLKVVLNLRETAIVVNEIKSQNYNTKVPSNHSYS